MDWQPIETAPKDGTPIELRFKGGFSNIRSGHVRRRVVMDERVHVGKWWSAADCLRAVGKKKSAIGARGALLAKNGGYWGSAGKHSKPMSGNPTHWRHLENTEGSTHFQREPPAGRTGDLVG